jgi:hypothetical protein
MLVCVLDLFLDYFELIYRIDFVRDKIDRTNVYLSFAVSYHFFMKGSL